MLVMFTALRHTPGMKKENGFTLIETLVAVSLVVILSASGLYGWDSWQRHQRLWQTASQVRDYLLFLRNHANRHNRDHQITRQRVGDRDCLVSSAVQGCEKDSPFVLLPLWPEVAIGEVTPSLGFSNPAMQRSSVVLPDPDGPSTVAKLPSATSRLARSRATVASPRRAGKVLDRSRTLSTGRSSYRRRHRPTT